MPYVVAPPTGTCIRTRLRLIPADEQVVTAVGRHLATLAGQDLAWRCRRGLHADRRTERKRSLTAPSSSRWAGTITRTANDQWRRGYRNLLDARIGLRRAIFAIDRRLAVPINGRHGRTRGYPSRVERYQKQRRRQHLRAKLAEVEPRLAEGRVSVCRGGRRLVRLRHHLDTAGLPASEWRGRWQAERLFLTADGEAEACWGNLTIRVHPTSSGRSCACRPHWRPYPTRRGRAAIYRLSARSYSTTAQISGPRRPPPVRSDTTSPTSPIEVAGTWTPPGGSPQPSCHRWRSCSKSGRWPWTSMPTMWPVAYWIPPAIQSGSRLPSLGSGRAGDRLP